MKTLITGAAGNLGSCLARYMMGAGYDLRLMVHRKDIWYDLDDGVEVVRADLADPETLTPAVADIDTVVHFAGILFAPGPENFLPTTNTQYFANLVDAAVKASVGKITLISFPHVEGESTPDYPATGIMDGEPDSVHARTRLAAERYMFERCEGTDTTPIVLRPGFVYAEGILMVEGMRWLAKRRLLGVWREPTHTHLISLPDFNRCCVAAIDNDKANDVYNLGDDGPITLQEFLDRACEHWGHPKPWRAPKWAFYWAAWWVELYARIFGTPAPITRDFIRIGMASYWSDTTKMKEELINELEYPTLDDGIGLL
ncbi:MAG: NAD-dependent epimerase/dehydratase family protein [bacterium]|nr:NAD-dependent epimerase/dehydratase family protein [bacterium]